MTRGAFLKRDVIRAVECAKALGIDVAGYEIAPDGTIRVLSKAALPSDGTARHAGDVAGARIKQRPWARSG